jgi:hypothetical protein
MAGQSKDLDAMMRERGIHNWNDYNMYLKAFKAVETLTEYYRRNPKKADDMKDSNPKVITAKKNLISTLYSTLNGVGGAQVPVAYAHNGRINNFFKDYFLKKDEKTCVYRHIAEVVGGIYANKISGYEEIMLTSKPTAPLIDLISGEQIAKGKKDRALTERLHQIINSRFETAPMKEFEQATKVFKNNILMQYQQFCWRTEEFESYLAGKHTTQRSSI